MRVASFGVLALVACSTVDPGGTRTGSPTHGGPASPATNNGLANPETQTGNVDAAEAPLATPVRELVPYGLYPRAVRLADGKIIASVVTPQPSGRQGATFLESTDEGMNFTVVGNIDDARAQTGLCCATLFRLAKPVGAMAAGTLLWAASIGFDKPSEPMTIGMWASIDAGRKWAFVSNVAVASASARKNGLWEPEFSQLDDGTLVGHWSDETDPAHSQKLIEARTTDGVHWTDYRDTVALPSFGMRPGMPGVRRLDSGRWVMSYELCGATDSCGVRVRTSADGWNWGDPGDPGLRPETLDGTAFRHAPTLTTNGNRIYLIGQLVFGDSGQISQSLNGSLIFANTEGGYGNWFPIRAPIPIPDAFDHYCPNYSSPLLPVADGKAVLEIATKWDGKSCKPYFARAPLGTGDDQGIVSGRAYSIVGLTGGLCLDLENGSSDPGATIRQWDCNGSPAQTLTPTKQADGTYAFAIGASRQCLAVAGGSAPGSRVQQQPCNGTAAQSWTLKNVGIDHYVVQAASGACLDIAGGSADPGTSVQEWTCNGLAPQIWKWVGH